MSTQLIYFKMFWSYCLDDEERLLPLQNAEYDPPWDFAWCMITNLTNLLGASSISRAWSWLDVKTSCHRLSQLQSRRGARSPMTVKESCALPPWHENGVDWWFVLSDSWPNISHCWDSDAQVQIKYGLKFAALQSGLRHNLQVQISVFGRYSMCND